jgi:hypothetical protein
MNRQAKQPAESSSITQQAKSPAPKLARAALEESLSQARADVAAAAAGVTRLKLRLATLNAEREPHVIPARLRGDQGANLQLEKLDSEISRTQRELQDFEGVLVSARSHEAAAKTALDVALWNERRDAVVARLQEFASGSLEKELDLAVERVMQLLRAFNERDDEVIALLNSIDPSLTRSAGLFRSSRGARGEKVGAKLALYVPTPLSSAYTRNLSQRSFAADAAQQFGRALEAVQGLEIVYPSDPALVA